MEALLQLAQRQLAAFDIRTDVPRRPPGLAAVFSRPGLSLSARAAAARAAARQPRQQAAAPAMDATGLIPHSGVSGVLVAVPSGAADQEGAQWQEEEEVVVVVRRQGGDGAAATALGPPPPDDAAWRAKRAKHQAYAEFVAQLAQGLDSPKLPPHAGGWAAAAEQLSYQVGLCEDWAQLAHLLRECAVSMGPFATGVLCKHLAGLATAKALRAQSAAERYAYQTFLRDLARHAADVAPDCTPADAAAIAYGAAHVGALDAALGRALVAATAPQLQAAARRPQGAAPWPPSGAAGEGVDDGGGGGGGGGSPPPLPAWAAEEEAGQQAPWTPAALASLAWGLGTAGVVPPAEWLDVLCAVALPQLASFQPNQLWGILWGLAKLGHLPPGPWMSTYLSCSQRQLRHFTAEGMANMVAALAGLGYVPDKLWLRAFCGMAGFNVRSFVAPHLTQVLSSLSALGYAPRPELRSALAGQVRRHMHSFSAPQLASVAYALAAYREPWHPGGLWLRDFEGHSARKMEQWGATEAAHAMWALARLGYEPGEGYRAALTAQLGLHLGGADPDALSMGLWALAEAGQAPPDAAWMGRWYERAAARAADFSPPALSNALSALSRLELTPPPEVMQALTYHGSSLLGACTPMELGMMIAALADLRWRPSETWLAAFEQQVMSQLPAMENEDLGLTLYGLASLGHPLGEEQLAGACRAAAQKLYSMSGEGLALLVWALGQYSYNPEPKWWDAFWVECGLKWPTFRVRAIALMLLGLAELGPRPAPPGEWTRRMAATLRARLEANPPRSWGAFVGVVRASAGLEPGEDLPSGVWLVGALEEVAAGWGLRAPV